jgi:S-DNA-T family DNA segregation ATPase FtsK/SpoIIIE
VTTIVVRRPPRRPAPDIPGGDLLIEAPPEIPHAAGTRWTTVLMALPMLTGTLAAALMFAGREGGSYSYVVGALFGVSSLAMLATSWGSYSASPRKADMMQARRDYLRHLAALRRRVRDTVAAQRRGLRYRHPEPGQLWSTVDSYRLWERRPTDGDFAVVRVGLGPQSLATPLQPQVTRPLEDLEPMTAGALRDFLDAYSVIPDLPVAVSLRGFTRIYLLGDGAAGLVRAMLAQLGVFHPPDDLLIAICAGAQHRERWEWAKWLPHALHPTTVDGVGRLRLISETGAALESVLGDILASRPRSDAPYPSGPHIVVVLDGADLTGATHLMAGGCPAGVTVLDLDGPPPKLPDRATLVMDVDRPGRRLHTLTGEQEGDVGVADSLSIVEAEVVARRLAPLRLADTGRAAELPGANEPDLATLLRIGDPDGYDAEHGWAARPDRHRLRVPIGQGTDGAPVVLDLKESAQDGMGPHGLLVGATGSGKSELLRTLVVGLAATHAPEALNFVLIDFKGGATFASLDRLPHTAAVITNLADALPMVDRMTEALSGELNRRQELLRRAGHVTSLREYDRARAGGAALAPLPVLLVICDEFSELLSAKPEFIDVFVQIGRLGRSLGVHLLLASQRLDEGRLRGLDTHLSYRIGLRTFSTLESRAVLGVADAFELPRAPGHGFLKYGTEPLARFKAAYVSGPYRTADPKADGAGRVRPYRTRPVPLAPVRQQTRTDSLLEILVGRLAGRGTAAHPVWLPPLSAPPALGDLLGPVGVDAVRGLTVRSPDLRGALTVPIALVDKPYEQRTDPLWLHLSGAAGHVAIVGGPRSGKSTVVSTLIAALALTHTPAEISCYCLDFGGGTLAALAALPHVGGIAGRQETAAVRRTVGEVATLLGQRENDRSSEHGHVFLVVDGWATLRAEYDDLEPVLTDLATRGLAYGVHLVVTASRWTDLRPGIRDLFGSRVELRLGDPTDSIAGRAAAHNVPERVPGHGLTADGRHCLVALPQLSTMDSIAAIARAVAAAWSGPSAPPVRLLPPLIAYLLIDVERDPARPWALPIGLAETDLRPVHVDFATEPHLLLFGDAECGKSSFLRALAATITRRFSPEQARIILVDYRRGLSGAVTTEHLIGYGTAAAQTRELIDSVTDHLDRRLADPAWTGPRCFVLVDDYDLVATGPSNPLAPLLDYLAQARDIGLHLVVARRSGGAGRALYEPVIQRLRELPSPGLVLSGDREEGQLLGPVRPGPLPPGRGWLVTRKEGVRLIQLAMPPDSPDPPDSVG